MTASVGREGPVRGTTMYVRCVTEPAAGARPCTRRWRPWPSVSFRPHRGESNGTRLESRSSPHWPERGPPGPMPPRRPGPTPRSGPAAVARRRDVSGPSRHSCRWSAGGALLPPGPTPARWADAPPDHVRRRPGRPDDDRVRGRRAGRRTVTRTLGPGRRPQPLPGHTAHPDTGSAHGPHRPREDRRHPARRGAPTPWSGPEPAANTLPSDRGCTQPTRIPAAATTATAVSTGPTPEEATASGPAAAPGHHLRHAHGLRLVTAGPSSTIGPSTVPGHLRRLTKERARRLTRRAGGSSTFFEPPVGFEPTTYALQVRCSGHLS